MAWNYIQNFNGLNTADLNGQDSWSGDANFDVETSVVFEGAKAVSCATAASKAVYRDLTAMTAGKMNIWMQKSSTVGGEVFTILKSGANGRIYVKFNASGNIQAYNADASPAYDTLQAYVKDVWYKITIDFNATTGKFSVLVNDVIKITDATMLNTGNIDRISLETDGTGDTGYWDNIRPINIESPAFIMTLASNWKNN